MKKIKITFLLLFINLFASRSFADEVLDCSIRVDSRQSIIVDFAEDYLQNEILLKSKEVKIGSSIFFFSVLGDANGFRAKVALKSDEASPLSLDFDMTGYNTPDNSKLFDLFFFAAQDSFNLSNIYVTLSQPHGFFSTTMMSAGEENQKIIILQCGQLLKKSI